MNAYIYIVGDEGNYFGASEALDLLSHYIVCNDYWTKQNRMYIQIRTADLLEAEAVLNYHRISYEVKHTKPI